jgi:hypothetical protein
LESSIDLSQEHEPVLEKVLKFLYVPTWKVEHDEQDGSVCRALLDHARLHDMAKRFEIPSLATLAREEFEDDLQRIGWNSRMFSGKGTFEQSLPDLVGLVYDEDKDNEALRERLQIPTAVARIVTTNSRQGYEALEKAFAISPKFALDLVKALKGDETEHVIQK